MVYNLCWQRFLVRLLLLFGDRKFPGEMAVWRLLFHLGGFVHVLHCRYPILNVSADFTALKALFSRGSEPLFSGIFWLEIWNLLRFCMRTACRPANYSYINFLEHSPSNWNLSVSPDTRCDFRATTLWFCWLAGWLSLLTFLNWVTRVWSPYLNGSAFMRFGLVF